MSSVGTLWPLRKDSAVPADSCHPRAARKRPRCPDSRLRIDGVGAARGVGVAGAGLPGRAGAVVEADDAGVSVVAGGALDADVEAWRGVDTGLRAGWSGALRDVDVVPRVGVVGGASGADGAETTDSAGDAVERAASPSRDGPAA